MVLYLRLVANYFSFLLQTDASYNGYLKHIEHQEAPPPLTDAEEELRLVKQSEVTRKTFNVYIA